MGEHLKLGISEKFQTLLEKVRGEKKSSLRKDIPIEKQKQNTINWSIKNAATRIVLARSVGELSSQLKEAQTSLRDGKDAGEIDGLRAAVMIKMEELPRGEVLKETQTVIENMLRSGDVDGAVMLLDEMAQDGKYQLRADQKKEVEDVLKSAKSLNDETSGDEEVIKNKILEVETAGDKLNRTVDKELKDIDESSREIETNIAKKYIREEASKAPKTRKAKTTLKVEKDRIDTASKQVDQVVDHDGGREEKVDNRFLHKLVQGGDKGFGSIDADGNLVIDMGKLDEKKANYLYARISTARGKYLKALGRPENSELSNLLEEVQFELRERLIELEDEAREELVARGLTPDEIKWEELSQHEKTKIKDNLDFVNDHESADDLLKHAQAEYARRGLHMTRSEQALAQLIRDNPDQAINFNEQGEWIGTAEDFFELCRLEIYKIRDSVPEDRLGNLVFEDTAQAYLALMSISTKNNPELKNMKDAVTKTLYLEFVVKSLWKAGGNHEAWQRAAGLLLREGSESNFFLTMKVREKLRGIDKNGERVTIPGFNIDDMFTMGELRAPNGQSWLAYISTDSIPLNESRLQELGTGLAKMTLEKARLRKKISEVDYRKQLAQLTNSEIKFDAEQLSWVRNYMQYVHTATLNVGEKLWLMDGTPPGDKGFEYASLPGGQFAEKSGLWPVLYFAKYQVTKYGFEGLGSLFIPNPGLLSYARGETLRHFMVASRNDDRMTNADGTLTKKGSGAKEFFFGGRERDADPKKDKEKMKVFTDFWEEIWLDSRTGTDFKSKGMRSLQNSRDVGLKMIADGKHKDFVNEMEFGELEKLMGHEIPGGSNEEKLKWVVGNLDYEMMEMKTMPSKREGDWVNKYSKYYVETVTLFQSFLDAPTIANKMAIIESVAKYNSATIPNLSKQLDDFMEKKRKVTVGLKEGGNPLNPLHYFGPEVADDDQKHLERTQDGDSMTMPMVRHSPTEGWYPGRGLKWSAEDRKEGKRNPMVMRKMEIQNAIAWGIVSPKEGGKMMRDWQKMVYFGEQITIGKLKIRPAMIPFLTPYLLMRGYWVDRMGLDWEDFKMIMSKQNEETWEKLKKLMGIDI